MSTNRFVLDVLNGVPTQLQWLPVGGVREQDVQIIQVHSFIEAMQLMQAVSAQEAAPPRVEKRRQEGVSPDEISQSVMLAAPDECPVCFSEVNEMSRLDCGHEFCFSCVQGWANTASTCPMCRGDFTRSIRRRV